MQNLNLQILWLNDSLGFCINCQTPKGIIPLTSYYFWPISEAWEQLRFELDSKSWILEKERIEILNQIVDIMNDWQQARLSPKSNGILDQSLVTLKSIKINGLS